MIQPVQKVLPNNTKTAENHWWSCTSTPTKACKKQFQKFQNSWNWEHEPPCKNPSESTTDQKGGNPNVLETTGGFNFHRLKDTLTRCAWYVVKTGEKHRSKPHPENRKLKGGSKFNYLKGKMMVLQENDNTPRYRTPVPQSPGNANYERNPFK